MDDRHREYREVILIDDDYLKSLINAIQSAKQRVDFETYIYKADKTGWLVANAFAEAAERGVQVRVLVDGVGTPEWGNEMTQKMEKAGVLARVYHPLPWLVRHWKHSAHTPSHFISKIFYLFSKINSRNHRKVCLIDDDIVYVGSANISDSLKKWRDTTVKLIGINPEALRYAFEKAWNHVPFQKKHKKFIFNEDSIFRLNYSWHSRRMFYRSMLYKVSHCKKRIWVTNAYFVPDNYLLKALINASNHGIDVRILLPHISDVFFVSLASRTFYSVLLKNGVSIYEYLPSVLHGKNLILDDWFSVGSSNLNYRSLNHDLEVDVTLQTEEAKKSLEAQFLMDLSRAQKITLEDVKKQSFYQYWLGRLILIARYLI